MIGRLFSRFTSKPKDANRQDKGKGEAPDDAPEAKDSAAPSHIPATPARPATPATPHNILLHDPEMIGLEACISMLEQHLGHPIDKVLYNPYGTSNKSFLQGSYRDRIRSSTKALQFLFAAYKKTFENPNALTELEQELLAELLPMNTIEGMQATLTKYLLMLQYLVKKAFGCTEKEAIHLLAKADEYAALKEPRPMVATFTRNQFSTTEPGSEPCPVKGSFLQLENPLNPWLQSTLDDLRALKNKDPISAPDGQPHWLDQIRHSHEEMTLLQHFLSTTNPSETVHTIASKHRTILGVANFLKIERAQFNENHALVDEIKYDIRYRSSMGASRDIIDIELRELFAIENYKHIVLESLRTKFACLAFSDDELRINIENTPILISTLITPIPLTAITEKTRHLSPDHALFDDKNVALMRLNPKTTMPGMRATIAQEIPEEMSIKLNGATTTFKPDIISTNHPQNISKSMAAQFIIETTGTEAIDALLKINAERIIHAEVMKGAKREVSALKEEERKLYEKSKKRKTVATKPIQRFLSGDLLKDIEEDIIRIKNKNFSGPNRDDPKQLELHLAALEEFIVTRLGGIAYGSCVSGKDRKGLETIYVDAMEQYYYLYGKYPKYTDEKPNRDNFVAIFAALFLSNHQRIIAGKNADGANGIKTPKKYLPKDIRDAIIKLSHEKIFEESELLANNNELDNIVKGQLHPVTKLDLDKRLPINFDREMKEMEDGFILIDTVEKPSSEEKPFSGKKLKSMVNCLACSVLESPAGYIEADAHQRKSDIFTMRIEPAGLSISDPIKGMIPIDDEAEPVWTSKLYSEQFSDCFNLIDYVPKQADPLSQPPHEPLASDPAAIMAHLSNILASEIFTVFAQSAGIKEIRAALKTNATLDDIAAIAERRLAIVDNFEKREPIVSSFYLFILRVCTNTDTETSRVIMAKSAEKNIVTSAVNNTLLETIYEIVSSKMWNETGHRFSFFYAPVRETPHPTVIAGSILSNLSRPAMTEQELIEADRQYKSSPTPSSSKKIPNGIDIIRRLLVEEVRGNSTVAETLARIIQIAHKKLIKPHRNRDEDVARLYKALYELILISPFDGNYEDKLERAAATLKVAFSSYVCSKVEVSDHTSSTQPSAPSPPSGP